MHHVTLGTVIATLFLAMPLWLAFAGDSKAAMQAERRVKDQKRIDAELIAAARALLSK